MALTKSGSRDRSQRALHVDARCVASGELASIPGLGAKRIAAYAELGITTFRALLLHLPKGHRELLHPSPIGDLLACESIQSHIIALRGTVIRYRSGRRRGSPSRLEIADASGRIEALSFALRKVPRSLHHGATVYLLGRVSWSEGRAQFVFDHHDSVDEGTQPCSHLPIYELPAPIPQRVHRAVIAYVLDSVPQAEIRLDEWAAPPSSCSLREALVGVHRPRTTADLAISCRRLAFEELASTVLPVLERRRLAQAGTKSSPISIPEQVRRELVARLPFRPTSDQCSAFDEICDDLGRRAPMHRLLHGEVGTGKTVVAMLAALAVVESGSQAAVLAPTALLAEQLARVARSLARDSSVHSFTRMTPSRERRAIAASVRQGSALLLVGTLRTASALRQAANLALVVVDEQHRFGVAQRARLRTRPQVDFLVMSATPIPRSLALTLYGDLDLSVLGELPPGRQAVASELLVSAAHSNATPGTDGSVLDQALSAIAEECRAGGRVFTLCPQIQASERSPWSTEVIEQSLRAIGLNRIATAHGRRSPRENELALAQLRSGEAEVLVATTVIEVGIDVREATLIVVLGAEHFGLAQLHQLRGRVGRGRARGRCLLVTGSGDLEVHARLRRFVATQSGFEVAELDLEARGAGEVAGERQHGAVDLVFARLPRDLDLLVAARAALATWLEANPPENRLRLPIPVVRTVPGPG